MGSPTGSLISTFVMFGAIILIFYFLMIRPQKKKDQQLRDMIAALKKGDRVVTIGGINGTVVTVKEQTIIIKVDDNARIEFNKGAISSVLEKKGESAAAKKNSKKTEAAKEVVDNKAKAEAETVEEKPAEEKETKETKEEKETK